MSEIVAIGGGQASFSFVQKLRALGYKEKITLVCGENIIPYQRPPLSKKFLLGDISKEQLFLRTESYYIDNGINLILGKKVVGIKKTHRIIELEDGFCLPYEKLFLGIGSKVKTLPDKMTYKIPGIYYIRSLEDIELLKKEFSKDRHLLILGGGYIGLEVASVASNLGLQVTIIEAQERILKRVASIQVADYFRDLHQRNGIKIKENVILKNFLFNNNRLNGALTNEGEKINADFIIAGIGIEPNTSLAEKAGIEVNNGIVVDETCRTSDQHIFSAGDCTNFPYKGQLIRLESVGNAIEQAEVAAEVIFGKKAYYKALPWFWSDQFKTKLQIAGLNSGYTDVVKRMNGDKISFWYYQDGVLKSVDAINDPTSYMVGKRLIEMNRSPDPEDIKTESFELKSLLRD